MDAVIRAAILSVSSFNHKDRTSLSTDGLVSGGHSVSLIMSLDLVAGVTHKSSTGSGISKHDVISHLEVTIFTVGERSLSISLSEFSLSLVDH